MVESDNTWQINKASGRYSDYPDRTQDMLRNVQKSFSNGGTKVDVRDGRF